MAVQPILRTTTEKVAAGDPFHAAGVRKGSTRYHRCDFGFLELLEEDYGISQYALRSAFMGIPTAPKKQAIALCEWATRQAGGDAEEAGRVLRAWVKKNKRGTYDPAILGGPELTHEYSAHLRSIGRL